MAILDVAPRSNKQRATVLALLALLALSAYTVFIAPPSLSSLAFSKSSPPYRQRPISQAFRASAAIAQLKHPSIAYAQAAARPQIRLSPEQELGAVTSFLASLPANSIPPSVDPANPIDPQLVLDFDTRSAQARDEVDDIVYDVWLRNPVVLFSRLHSPLAREVKAILSDMNLRPSPTVFEVDQRADAAVLAPLLHRLTSVPELPILLIGGVPIASMDEIRSLSASGDLKTMVAAAGAVVDGAKKKKKGSK